MRITNNMLVGNMINYIGNNLTRMDKYQKQLATGKKIDVPSDDPVVAARALKLRTDLSEVQQYSRNVQDAQSWMEITESTIGQLGDIMQRARELAVEGANGTMTPEDLEKTKSEIQQLKNQVVNLSNTTYAGRYVFSGFKTDLKLMNDDGTYAIDVNNANNIKYEIGIGDNINVNVPGGELFEGGNNITAGTTGQLITTFDNFITALNSGVPANVEGTIGSFDTEINNLLRVRADVGARTNRIELTSNRLDSDNLNFTNLMSTNEDVDMAETIMNLKNEENVYRASLAGGARIIQPSLVDFLR